MRIDREKLAVAMVRRDLNVTRLSELSGLSRPTISAIKSGKSCSSETAYKLAAVLGCDIIKEEG